MRATEWSPGKAGLQFLSFLFVKIQVEVSSSKIWWLDSLPTKSADWLKGRATPQANRTREASTGMADTSRRDNRFPVHKIFMTNSEYFRKFRASQMTDSRLSAVREGRKPER